MLPITQSTFLAWLYLVGMSQYKPKMKGKMSQKLNELKGIETLYPIKNLPILVFNNKDDNIYETTTAITNPHQGNQ